MSQSITTPIEDKLWYAWRQQRRYYNLRGLSRFLIWLVFMIVLDFIIDWGIFFQYRLTGRLGLVLLVMNVVVLGAVLWFEWLRYLKPYDPLLVSLEIEEQHPELSSVLVSYTQLDGPVKNQPNVSVELIQAMRQQAVVQTRRLDFREIVDFGQLRNLLLVAGVVLLFFAAVGVTKTEYLGALMRRLAGADTPYPTQTTITKVTKDLTIRAGDSAIILAQVDPNGVIPEEGELRIRPADGSADWKVLPLQKTANGSGFERELKEINKDLEHYVKIGDDQSEVYRVRVVPAPRIVATRVELHYPDYMKKDPGTSDQLNLEVPVGTVIQWQLSCDKAIKQLLVKTKTPTAKGEKESTIQANVEGSGKSATFEIKVDQGFKYTFLWTEDESGKDFQYDDVQYSVRVIPDAIPDLDLLRPGADGLATVQKTMKLVARAADDYGLSQARLVYSVNGSAEERIPIGELQGERSKEISFAWELKKSIKELKPGMQIEVALEVRDRNPGPQRWRRSASRQVTIVDTERYLQWYRRELAAQRDEIKRARDRERSSSKSVKQLKEQETGPKP